MRYDSFVWSAALLGLAMPAMAVGGEGKATPSSGPDVKPFFRKPWLLGAHRGGAGLWPENTLVAFKAAAKRWPDIILETDARMTADGHVVLLHDGTVDRTTDGTGPIAKMTLAEVKRLDAGYKFSRDRGRTFPWRGKGVRIATLVEALAVLPESRFEIELKPADGVTDPTLRVIRKARAEDRVLLASFDPQKALRARKLAPRIASCYELLGGLGMLSKLREGGERWERYRPKADVLSLMEGMLKQYELTPAEIRAVQAKGIFVQIHTPNTPERIRKVLDLNPDSILTDRPDLLAEIIAKRAKQR